jgi:hypothetical protein
MTSTELVQQEIRRFLRSPEPEVLCITGDWGVGKTYTWQKAMDETRATNAVALSRYSYASLFGINSLDGLKLALFENLEILDAPPETTFQKGVHGAKTLLTHAKKLSGVASAIPVVGPALARAGPLYFSLIRDQIICIDDLERRGKSLDIKDVFGLVSFLREQRHCKVMLLLNSDALGDSKTEFDTYFEKVIDARLIFAPSASEAVGIALTKNGPVIAQLRSSCEVLGISNIRVIKKIERLARQIEPILARFAPQVTQSAIRSVALFGWSKFQPEFAPPIDFIRVGMQRYFTKGESKEKLSPKEQEWDTILTRYDFSHMDDLDHELWKFVDTGILDPVLVETRGLELDQQVSLQKQLGAFEQTWRPFHDSFNDNLPEVVVSLVSGAKQSFQVVSLSHLNETVQILRALGQDREAKEVLDYFVAKKPKSFWEKGDPFFQLKSYEDDIAAMIQAEENAKHQVFSPEVDLIDAGRTYDPQKIAKLAAVPVDEFYRILKSKKGQDLSTFVLSALEFRRIANASAEMREVVRRMEEALTRIACESRLNAIRVRKYGIKA